MDVARSAPATAAPTRGPAGGRLVGLCPGVALAAVISGAALALQSIEISLFGRAWLEALVLAILLGMTTRALWTPGARWWPGVAFAAKPLLELSVVLLGAAMSTQALAAVGPRLIAGIEAVVALALVASYGVGRAMGLGHRLATLVACGNSICGNSAIAAVAPVIGADGREVASSIAFTAVLGVIVVLTLPMLAPLLSLDGFAYGVLAGLTVYAVPQVLAATAPLGPLATQIGTLVKMVRVLMLGPIVLGLSVRGGHAGRRPPLRKLVPWFIIGFLALAGLRSLDLIPEAALAPAAGAARLLTILGMAALGLGVDARVVARAGGRVTAVVCVSLMMLGALALALIALLAAG